LLKKLEDNRTQILLAEIGAYLHDLGKATKNFVLQLDKTNRHNYKKNLDNALLQLLRDIEIDICGRKANLLDIFEKHHREQESKLKLKPCQVPELIRLLYAEWNGFDGIDSGMDKDRVEQKNEQDSSHTFISSAFGYEFYHVTEEEAERIKGSLQALVQKHLQEWQKSKNISEGINDIIKIRNNLIYDTKRFYLKFLGETRRPANDVTLWDHSYSVATLFKCAVAKNLLDRSKASFDALDFRCQVLAVSVDVLGILAKGIKIGDVLGYKSKIDKLFNDVKCWIEVVYPIGNELYRDTTGIYFLLPELNSQSLQAEIIDLIKKICDGIEPELAPAVTFKPMTPCRPECEIKYTCLDENDKIPNDIKRNRRDFEGKIRNALLALLPGARVKALDELNFPTTTTRFNLQNFTDNWSSQVICPICRLRPMAQNEESCAHCMKRRESRSRAWLMKPEQKTIWLDEVADQNGLVALLVGCFHLDPWLKGDFIKTMKVGINNSSVIKKSPSPARIRRCWETIQNFNSEEILKKILPDYFYGRGRGKLHERLRHQRLCFKIVPKPGLKEGATLDLEVSGVRFSPVCVDAQEGLFCSTVNLELLSKLGKNAAMIAACLNAHGQDIKIKREQDKSWQTGFCLQDAVEAWDDYQGYYPFINIYDYPDQFMVLVPAFDALAIAKGIYDKYCHNFSKVRDRLPLHLGVLAFHRRTPLYLALDAAKRLVEAFHESNEESMKAKVGPVDLNEDERKITLDLQPITSDYPASEPLRWVVSYATGDPLKEDSWHPYFRICGEDPQREDYSFNYTDKGDYVVHVKALQFGDEIMLEKSLFKLAYLGNAADRFVIDEGLRVLDDIKRLIELWAMFERKFEDRKWSYSQVCALWEELNRFDKEKAGSLWQEHVRSSLFNILEVNKEEEPYLFCAVKDGLLERCLSWHMQIGKIKPGRR